MGIKTDNRFMIDSLTLLLNENDHLYHPFYGCLLPTNAFGGRNYFGFFGRTDTELLIAILNPFNGKKIDWTIKIPLDIKKIKIHKTIITRQYIVKLMFNEGNPCRIRMSRSLLCGDFKNQEANVSGFANFCKQYK